MEERQTYHQRGEMGVMIMREGGWIHKEEKKKEGGRRRKKKDKHIPLP